MEGTTGRSDRLTRASRGIRQWEGAWLGWWNRFIGNVRSDTATGMPCSFHLRLKTSVDSLSGNTAQVLGSTRATGECNISGTYYWVTKRKCNQLDMDIQRSYLPERRLCLSNPSWEHTSSVKVTTHLVKHLKHLKHTSYQTSLLESRHTT